MLHRPEQQGPAASASLSPTTAIPSASSSSFAYSSSPPSTSASTLDTSSLFIPRRRPPPPHNLRAPLNARHGTGTGIGKAASYSSLRRVSAPGASTSMTPTGGFSKVSDKLCRASGREEGQGDAMLDLQSEMDGVSLHQHQHTHGLAAPSHSSHELAVDIKRRLFNDGPQIDQGQGPGQGQLAQPPWHTSSSCSPEDRHEYTRSPMRRISQAQTQAQGRDSPPGMGILTRSKVCRTGSVRISDATPQRRSISGPYHDGSLNGNGHGNGSEARNGGAGAGAAAPNRGSPRCSPLRTCGRGRAATPYPGESTHPHSEAPAAASSSSTSLYPAAPVPVAELSSHLGTSPLSPLSHSHSLPSSLSSSYPTTTTTTNSSAPRPSTSTSTSTILLSHAESSSLQRAHFLSEKAQQEERELLRGLEMCTGLGRRLGGWDGQRRAGAGGAGGVDEGEGGDVGEGGRVLKKVGGRGRDRWVLPDGDGDEDLHYWNIPDRGIGDGEGHGQAFEEEGPGGGGGDIDYAHEEDDDLFGDGGGDDDLFCDIDGAGNEERDELFDLDDDDLDDDDADAGYSRKVPGSLRAGMGSGTGIGMGMGMDAVHESSEEEDAEEKQGVVGDEEEEEEEEEEWSR